MRPPYGLQSLISDALQRLNLAAQVKEHTSLTVWDEVVGEQVAGAAQPQFVKDGQLFVVTKSSVWANELSLYKADIIARLNRRIGGKAVKDIIFKTGRLPQRVCKTSDAPEPDEPLEGIPLSQEELEEIEAAADGAGEAAEDVRKLMATALRLEKWKKTHGWKPCTRCGVLQNSASGVCPPCQTEP